MAPNSVSKGTDIPLLKRIFSKKMLICLAQGFSSGLPFYLLINLASAWLKSYDLDLKQIGIFVSVTVMPYAWKFLWAPLLDRYNICKCGRRRSWMFVSQFILLVIIFSLGLFTPKDYYYLALVLCFLLGLFSATQDIALDAYRREILEDEELGLGNSIFVNGYRIAGLIPGGLSLILSDHMSWFWVFTLTSIFMLPGALTTFLIKETQNCSGPRTLVESVIQPFLEFFRRKGFWGVLGVIGFIFLYKFGDSMATAQATPFYMDMGYSKSEIGYANKSIGLPTMIIGGLVGGVLMLRIGINKALWFFGVAQVVTILGYVLIAHVWNDPSFMTNILADISSTLESILGVNWHFEDKFAFPSFTLLALVIGGECLGAGLGTACFVAYMCRETSKAYVATQLALFTALSAIPRSVCIAVTGFIIEATGWENFFIICYALAIPGMIMLIYIAPFSEKGRVTS